jgi:hypothetical protein
LRWIILYEKHAVDSMETLIKFVYGEEMDGDGLIVSPTNKRSDEVNDQSLDIFGGQAEEFICYDKADEDKKGEGAEEQPLPAKLIKVRLPKSSPLFCFLFLVETRVFGLLYAKCRSRQRSCQWDSSSLSRACRKEEYFEI